MPLRENVTLCFAIVLMNTVKYIDTRVLSQNITKQTAGTINVLVAELYTNETDLRYTESCPKPGKEYVSPVHGKPRCCRTCEPGNGMLRLCTDVEDTQCVACETGSEFSPYHSATEKCRPCRLCQDLHPLARIRSACSPTLDTECECIEGYFMDIPNQTCKQCSRCGTDEFVVSECQWNADIKCRKCPDGFELAQNRTETKCVPSKTGSDTISISVLCSTKGSVVCCLQNQTNCSTERILWRNPWNTGPRNEGRTQNQMLPIYCSIMGLIIVFLIFYVVYKLWRQRDSLSNGKLLSDGGCSIHAAGKGNKYVLPIPSGVGRPISGTFSCKSEHSNMTNGFGNPSPPGDYERGPLLYTADECSGAESFIDMPLCTEPTQLLGYFVWQLAKRDWSRLENAMHNYTKIQNATNSNYSTLLNHALEQDQLSPNAENIEKLSKAAKFVAILCNNNSVTIGSLTKELQSAGMEDLASRLLEQRKTNHTCPTYAL